MVRSVPDRPFEAFVAAYRQSQPDGSLPIDEPELRAQIDEARSAWPTVVVPEKAFASAIGDSLGKGLAVDALDVPELWLAIGCAAGVPAALREFEAAYLANIDRVVAHMRLSADTLAEALQVARRRLLVGTDGRPPKIVGYAGRGQVRTLVRVVATRAALDIMRAQGRRKEVADDGLSAVLLASASPESVVAHGQKTDAFRAAFEGAIAELEPADRTLLRLYAVNAVGLDGLALALGIHRSTAARRLAKIRKTLEQMTRQRLAAVGFDGDALESVVGVVEAGLELTLSRILADSAGSSGGSEFDATGED